MQSGSMMDSLEVLVGAGLLHGASAFGISFDCGDFPAKWRCKQLWELRCSFRSPVLNITVDHEVL